MKKFKPSQKLIIFFYVLCLALFCYHFIFRPMILDWGATVELQSQVFSGDRFTGDKSHSRAVLINASPEEVWPWLIQMGQDRGGFYSYQFLENLFRADMKNIYEIKPEFQISRKAGDTVWLANKDHYSGEGFQILAEVIPFKSFVMVGGEDYLRIKNGEKASGSWSFYLYSENENQTWLIARSSEGNISFANKLLRYFFFEIPHFIMERKTLVTIRKLADKNRMPSTTNLPNSNKLIFQLV